MKQKAWSLLAEAAAIVASILLAFAIDAWWSDREEGQEAIELLLLFDRELNSNIELVQRDKLFRQAKLKSAKEIMAWASKIGPPRGQHQKIDTLINDLTYWGDLNFGFGAIDSLVQSGKLAYIDDLELRSEIASWRYELEELKNLENQDTEFYFKLLLPFLTREKADLAQIGNASRGRPGDPNYLPPPTQDEHFPVGDPVDHAMLLQNKEFIGIVVALAWAQADLIVFSERFVEQADKLSKLIKETTSRD